MTEGELGRQIQNLLGIAMIAGLILTPGLIGCATSPHPTLPKEVPVPVARSCVPDNTPARPDDNSYPDTDDKLLGLNEGPETFAAIAAGRVLRIPRMAITEAVVDGCR